jgi:L-cysteine:1D-myo-inositol 2-amino-2-deoxy-alpha-D-glucopyranoside ligase
LQLYNSLSRSLEEFVPADTSIAVYVCGITPYDTTHLGHAFTYTCADLLIRYLEYRGHPVRYVQNVTDIDDDILRAADRAGEEWQALGNRWTAHFMRDMRALGARPPEHYPRASEVIPEICAQVQRLIDKRAAYVCQGSVYFDLRYWPQYGQLSRLSRDEMLPVANERGNKPDDPNKRDPLDFVLWQTQAPGEPAWDSPWGPGRPGWHIECSTMAGKFLGETVDIHAGGADLVFPHHESEIAQAEPLSGRPFVRFWMHIAMVEHEGQKMSKSLGNLVMIRDLLGQWSPDALRLYLADHHYRSSWSYSEADLKVAQARADRLKAAAGGTARPPAQDAGSRSDGRRAEPGEASSGDTQAQRQGADAIRRGWPMDPSAARIAFNRAMEADLDASAALEALEGLADHILQSSEADASADKAREALRELAGVLGLRLGLPPEPRVTQGWDLHLARFATP